VGDRKGMKMCIWNVVGIMNKDKEVWDYLRTCDVIGVTETWTDEGKWGRIRHRLPKEFDWKCRVARKEGEKRKNKWGNNNRCK
jgi:hypothetical protein